MPLCDSACPPRCTPTSNSWGTPPWHIDFAPPAAPLPKEADFVVVGARIYRPRGGSVAPPARSRQNRGGSRSFAHWRGRQRTHGRNGPGRNRGGRRTRPGRRPRGLHRNSREARSRLRSRVARRVGNRTQRRRWAVSHRVERFRQVARDARGSGRNARSRETGERAGARGAPAGRGIFENTRVENIDWSGHPLVRLAHAEIRAGKILFATNALSTELSGLAGAEPRLTLAVASEPLREEQLREIGLGERKPFYTIDFPYLWGRVRPDNSVIWGSGLVVAPSSRNLASIDITSEDCRRLLASLETRVRGLHPALRSIGFTHRWGGPILFRESWVPVFDWHPKTDNAAEKGAYENHGPATQSVLGSRRGPMASPCRHISVHGRPVGLGSASRSRLA